LVGSFRLDPEEGALFIKSLEAEVERSAERPDEDPVTRTADHPVAARRADALVALVARALDGEVTGDRVCRFQVVVHSDAPVLAGDAERRTATATRSTSTGSSPASACSANKRAKLPQDLLGVAAVDVAHEGRVDAVAEELPQPR
jgi:hypothetical protein